MRHPIREALTSLPEHHTVLHGLEVKEGMVEHVVVGPSGVYAIVGRHWPATFTVRPDGRLSYASIPIGRPTRDVLEQAGRLRRQLAASGVVDQKVMSVVSLAGGRLKHGTFTGRELLVIEVTNLAGTIARRQRTIDNVRMYKIADELTPLARA